MISSKKKRFLPNLRFSENIRMCCISQVFVAVRCITTPNCNGSQTNTKHFFCAHGSAGKLQLSRAGSKLQVGFRSAPHPKTRRAGAESSPRTLRNAHTQMPVKASAQNDLTITSSHIPLALASHMATPKVNAAGTSSMPLSCKVTC